MESLGSGQPGMVLKDTKRPIAVVLGIMFLLSIFFSPLSGLASLFIAVNFFIGKKNKPLYIGLILYGIVSLVELLDQAYSFISFGYKPFFVLLGILPLLLLLLALVFLAIVNMTMLKNKFAIISKYFWAPILLSAALAVVNIILSGNFSILIFFSFYALLYYLTGMWITTDFVFVPESEHISRSGYVSIAKHIVLLIFTFGVWHFIWLYRTTDYLNKCEAMAKRTPANQLLLCMFVPFYIIYWTYQSAKRIDLLAREKGTLSDLSAMCLILEIFLPIIPPVIMQNKINEIETNDTYASRIISVKETKETSSADELKKFKELLDMGAITSEEYEEKKKELLHL